MASLPSGTVIFLFTNIEGTIQLGGKVLEEMQASPTRHHSILREGISENLTEIREY